MKLLHALVALLLSILTPGLGAVYAGRTRRGVWLWAVTWGGLGLMIAARYVLLPPSPALAYGSLVPAVLGLAVWLLGSILLAATVIRHGRVPGKGWLRALLGLGMLAASVALVVAFVKSSTRSEHRWGLTYIATDLMQPTLWQGESIVVWQGYYDDHEVRAGEAVTIHHEAGRHLERIIALPGDLVSFPEGRLVINGTEVRRTPVPGSEHRFVETLQNGVSYEVLQDNIDAVRSDTLPIEIPAGKYLVLLDNRLGPRPAGFPLIDRADLFEKLEFVLWSHDFSRWGQPIR